MRRALVIIAAMAALQFGVADFSVARKSSVPGGLKASEMIGQAVYNREREKLGEIKELVIDAAEGEVAYAVLAFGGT